MIVSSLDALSRGQLPKHGRTRQLPLKANIHRNGHFNRFLRRRLVILALTGDEWPLHHRRDVSLIRYLMDARVGQKTRIVAAHVLFRPGPEVTVDELANVLDVLRAGFGAGFGP